MCAIYPVYLFIFVHKLHLLLVENIHCKYYRLGQNCVHLTYNQIQAAKPTPINMRSCQIFHACKILQKKWIC